MRRIGRWLSAVLDRADYLLTLARLSVLDWLHPPRETPVDRAIREEGDRLRKAFRWLDERRRGIAPSPFRRPPPGSAGAGPRPAASTPATSAT
jgi:hypothetical protein